MPFNYQGTPSWWQPQYRPTRRSPNAVPVPSWYPQYLAAQAQLGGRVVTNLPRSTIQGTPGAAPGYNFGGGLFSGYNWPAQAAPPTAAPAPAAAASPYPNYNFGGGLFSGYRWPTTAGVPNATTPAGQAPAAATAPYSPPAAPAQAQYQQAPPGINQQWYSQFQAEHQGQTPDEYYAMTSAQAGNPHEGLADALADLQWSQAFARDKGRPPNADEWRWWWFTTREGGTPEAKAAAQNQGGGRGGGGGGGPTGQVPPVYVPPQVWWR